MLCQNKNLATDSQILTFMKSVNQWPFCLKTKFYTYRIHRKFANFYTFLKISEFVVFTFYKQ
jgi:hypothetical protein